MEQKSNAFLETEKLSTLMRKYSLPCIISLVVAALYNIVDQIFIANADYLGSYGNAANTVVFPLTVVALAIAVMIGDGACAFVSISLGADRKDDAHRSIGNAIVLCLGSSVLLTAVYLLAMEPILTFFGGKVNAETYACAKEYFFWIALGMPFYMFGQAMNPIIRSDGSPRFAMVSTVAGAITNIILDPIFIFPLKMGMMGAAVATVAGQILTAGLAVWYLFHMKAVEGKTDLALPASGYHQLSQPDLSGHLHGRGAEHGHQIRRTGSRLRADGICADPAGGAWHRDEVLPDRDLNLRRPCGWLHPRGRL